jgi:hypothetical protein
LISFSALPVVVVVVVFRVFCRFVFFIRFTCTSTPHFINVSKQATNQTTFVKRTIAFLRARPLARSLPPGGGQAPVVRHAGAAGPLKEKASHAIAQASNARADAAPTFNHEYALTCLALAFVKDTPIIIGARFKKKKEEALPLSPIAAPQ